MRGTYVPTFRISCTNHPRDLRPSYFHFDTPLRWWWWCFVEIVPHIRASASQQNAERATAAPPTLHLLSPPPPLLSRRRRHNTLEEYEQRSRSCGGCHKSNRNPCGHTDHVQRYICQSDRNECHNSQRPATP